MIGGILKSITKAFGGNKTASSETGKDQGHYKEISLPDTAMARRVLAMADGFVAKMAGRKTRASLSPVKAVKSMVMGAEGLGLGVGSAMAQAAGFYPPGSYMQLANGETAVSVQRGERANTPWVVPIVDKDGMPNGH